MDGIAIIDRVLARGALVKVLDKPHLHLTSNIGNTGREGGITKRANEAGAAAKAKDRRSEQVTSTVSMLAPDRGMLTRRMDRSAVQKRSVGWRNSNSGEPSAQSRAIAMRSKHRASGRRLNHLSPRGDRENGAATVDAPIGPGAGA